MLQFLFITSPDSSMPSSKRQPLWKKLCKPRKNFKAMQLPIMSRFLIIVQIMESLGQMIGSKTAKVILIHKACISPGLMITTPMGFLNAASDISRTQAKLCSSTLPIAGRHISLPTCGLMPSYQAIRLTTITYYWEMHKAKTPHNYLHLHNCSKIQSIGNHLVVPVLP